MPRQVRITKEDIINATVDIVRRSGEQAINARAIAAELNCSTQPIFSNFGTMDQFRLAVVERAERICQEYMDREVERGEYPIYKANGMAYIRFAKEERELFKLLYMRSRSRETQAEDSPTFNQMEAIVHNNTGLESGEAKMFHLEMWAYVHGIATMFATGFLDLDWELVSRMLTDAYWGMRKQYGME